MAQHENEGYVLVKDIEQKRGNVRARSMSEYIKKHPDYQLKGLRISMMGYQDQGWIDVYKRQG